ncbi:hypothetical protein [Pendulispora rubella]
MVQRFLSLLGVALATSAAIAACSSDESPSGGGGGSDGGPDAALDTGLNDAANDAAPGDASSNGDASDASSTSDAKPGPSGETCAEAIDITAQVDANKGFTGKATGAADDPSTCTDKGRRKSHLTFTAKPGNYQILWASDSPPSGPSQPDATVDVRTACQANASTELACEVRAGFINPKFGVSKAGTVHLVLNGDWFAPGYTIYVRRMGACFSSNDCSNYSSQRTCDTATGICVQ